MMEKTKEIIKLYTQDEKSISFIMKELNVTRYFVEKVLKENNIAKNDKYDDMKRHEQIKNITKEMFLEYYVKQNLSYNECAEKLGCSVKQLKRRNSEWKIKKDNKKIAETRQKTFERKYGSGINSARQIKGVQEQIQKNYFEKHGVINPSQNKEVQEKRKQSYLNKTGYENPFSNPEVKEKIKKHYQKKYGDEEITNPSQVISIHERQKKLSKISHGLLKGHTYEEIKIMR